jgi:hypothetical protein
MGLRGNYAAKMDAKLNLRLEVCALGMGQRRNDAVRKGAHILL